MAVRLDPIDWRIIRELQADGRMTNVELASRVGISAPPCLRRVRALEEQGVIKGYRALVEPRAVGRDVAFFAFVNLASQAEADLDAFATFLTEAPFVREATMLSGDTDFVLKCVVADLPAFQTAVAALTAAPSVRGVRTAIALKTTKDSPLVEVEVGHDSAS